VKNALPLLPLAVTATVRILGAEDVAESFGTAPVSTGGGETSLIEIALTERKFLHFANRSIILDQICGYSGKILYRSENQTRPMITTCLIWVTCSR
jgi:hypothetical protein